MEPIDLEGDTVFDTLRHTIDTCEAECVSEADRLAVVMGACQGIHRVREKQRKQREIDRRAARILTEGSPVITVVSGSRLPVLLRPPGGVRMLGAVAPVTRHPTIVANNPF